MNFILKENQNLNRYYFLQNNEVQAHYMKEKYLNGGKNMLRFKSRIPEPHKRL